MHELQSVFSFVTISQSSTVFSEKKKPTTVKYNVCQDCQHFSCKTLHLCQWVQCVFVDLFPPARGVHFQSRQENEGAMFVCVLMRG